MFFMRYVLAAVLLTGGAVLASLAHVPSAEAQGQQIEAAKAAGIIGERIDGYLGIVEDGAVDASLRRRVNEINAKRRAAYDELADDSEATAAQVARLTGEKLVERAASGEYVLTDEGVWVRKAG